MGGITNCKGKYDICLGADDQNPALAMIYNGCMCGTDSFNQFLTYFRKIVMTKRWQTRIFTHFLMAGVVNAHI